MKLVLTIQQPKLALAWNSKSIHSPPSSYFPPLCLGNVTVSGLQSRIMRVADSDNKPPRPSGKLFYFDTVASVTDSCLPGANLFVFSMRPWTFARCVLLTLCLSWFVCVRKYIYIHREKKGFRPEGWSENKKEGETDDEEKWMGAGLHVWVRKVLRAASQHHLHLRSPHHRFELPPASHPYV